MSSSPHSRGRVRSFPQRTAFHYQPASPHGGQAARARSGQVRSATYAPKTAKSIWSRGIPTQSPASAESPSKSRRGRKEARSLFSSARDDYDMKDAFDGDIDPSGRTILGVLSGSSSSSSSALSSSIGSLSSSSSSSAFSSSAFPFYPSYPSYPSYSYSYSSSRSFPLHSLPDSNSPSSQYSPLPPSDAISEDPSYRDSVSMFNDFKDYRGRSYNASTQSQDVSDSAPLLDDKRSYYERYEPEQGGENHSSDYSREFSRAAGAAGGVHDYFYSSYSPFYPLAASGSGLSQATTLSSRSRTPTSDASNGSNGSQSSQGGLSESPPPETARDSLLRQLEQAEGDEVEIDTLALLFDPPVQGCELQPYVSVRQNGELKALQSQSLEAAKSGGLLPSETSSFPEGKAEFRWFRGPKRICSVSSCGNVASVQCLSCLRCGLSPNLAYFCSQKCLKESWPQHRHLHSLHSAPSSPWDEDENEDDLFEKGADAPERIGSKFPPPSPPEWVLVSRQRIYVATAEDVGCCLRLECNPLNKSEPSSTKILYTMPVSMPPPAPIPRQAIYKVPPSGLAGRGFKVLNYNILAQIYATQQAYPYATLWSLQWSYRKAVLLRDILSHNADVICLQEVQANHFEKFFHPELYKAGYDGVLKRKNRPAVGDDPGAIDGCATFYKRDRFALCEQYGIGFNDAARRDYPEGKSLQRLLKGNVALVIVLEDVGLPRTAGRRQQKRRLLCVANTHICANPELTEVKLWQTWVLVKELEKLVLHRDLPLLLCGDFNSLLDSSVYEFLSSERVDSSHEVFKQDPFKVLPNPSALQHGLPLSSAYGAYGEPKFTNYTGHFVGVLDYIWHSKPHLYPTSCLVIEEEPQLKKEVALPNAQFPSDHLPLVSEFDWFAEA